MNITITELGCAGHFIGARNCHWRRHTQVGKYRISSIGEYVPYEGQGRKQIGAGPDAFFETYVFETTGEPAKGSECCGCIEVVSWSEIDSQRYASAGDAQAGHEAFVKKYADLIRKPCDSEPIVGTCK